MPFFKKRNAERKSVPLSLIDDKVFCVMPWVHFHVGQNGNVTPCCQAPWGEEASFGNINSSSIDAIWKGDKIESFRNQMLKGIPHSSCSRCYEKEKSGWISLREITNDKYEDKINELALKDFHDSVYENPVYFDIRFSNACNLKCRICNSASSSSWFNDEVELGLVDDNKSALTTAIIDEEKFYSEFKNKIGTIEEIYFAGGEPLMMDQHFKILDFLIESGNTNCKLFYNTNLSNLKFKDKDVVEYWKHFNYVNLAVSLDDIGRRLEYQRKNIKWEKVKENFIRIKNETSNVQLMISPTVNLFNILSITELHRTLVEDDLVRVEDIVPTLLVYPKEFNIQLLSPQLKDKAKNRIKYHLDWLYTQQSSNAKKMDYVLRQYQNVLTFIDHELPDQFRINLPAKIRDLDRIRNEDFVEIFPELKSMLTNV